MVRSLSESFMRIKWGKSSKAGSRVHGGDALCTQEFCQVWLNVTNVIISEYKLQSIALTSMVPRAPSSEIPGLCYSYRLQGCTPDFLQHNLMLRKECGILYFNKITDDFDEP